MARCCDRKQRIPLSIFLWVLETKWAADCDPRHYVSLAVIDYGVENVGKDADTAGMTADWRYGVDCRCVVLYTHSYFRLQSRGLRPGPENEPVYLNLSTLDSEGQHFINSVDSFQ